MNGEMPQRFSVTIFGEKFKMNMPSHECCWYTNISHYLRQKTVSLMVDTPHQQSYAL